MTMIQSKHTPVGEAVYPIAPAKNLTATPSKTTTVNSDQDLPVKSCWAQVKGKIEAVTGVGTAASAVIAGITIPYDRNPYNNPAAVAGVYGGFGHTAIGASNLVNGNYKKGMLQIAAGLAACAPAMSISPHSRNEVLGINARLAVGAAALQGIYNLTNRIWTYFKGTPVDAKQPSAEPSKKEPISTDNDLPKKDTLTNVKEKVEPSASGLTAAGVLIAASKNNDGRSLAVPIGVFGGLGHTAAGTSNMINGNYKKGTAQIAAGLAASAMALPSHARSDFIVFNGVAAAGTVACHGLFNVGKGLFQRSCDPN